MGPMLNGEDDLMTNGMEKTDMLNVLFSLIFTVKTCLHKFQVPEISGKA